MTKVELYTDGACSGNPGPGGWGCVLVYGSKARQISGFEELTTNNRMELLAVIRGLEAITRPCSIKIVTDSTYVKNAFTEGWLKRWKQSGWKTADKKPVKNKDLWEELGNLCDKHEVTWEWVKGHSGHGYNEMCDELARQAIARKGGVDDYIEPLLKI